MGARVEKRVINKTLSQFTCCNLQRAVKYLGRGLSNLSGYVQQRIVRWYMIGPKYSSIDSHRLSVCNNYIESACQR